MAENRNFDLNSNFQFSEIPLKKRKDSRLSNPTPSSYTEGSSSSNPLKKRYFSPLSSYREGCTSSHSCSAKGYLSLSTDEEENTMCVNLSSIHNENRVPPLHSIGEDSYLKGKVDNLKPETVWKPDKDSQNYMKNSFMAPALSSDHKGSVSTDFPQLPFPYLNPPTNTTPYFTSTMALIDRMRPEGTYSMIGSYTPKSTLKIPSPSKKVLLPLSPHVPKSVPEKYNEEPSSDCIKPPTDENNLKSDSVKYSSNLIGDLAKLKQDPTHQVYSDTKFPTNNLQISEFVTQRVMEGGVDHVDTLPTNLRSPPLQGIGLLPPRVAMPSSSYTSLSGDDINQHSYSWKNDLKHLPQASTSGLQIENDKLSKLSSSEDESDYDDPVLLKPFKWLSTDKKSKENGDKDPHSNRKDTELQETLKSDQHSTDNHLLQHKDDEIDKQLFNKSHELEHETDAFNDTLKNNWPESDNLFLKSQWEDAGIENSLNNLQHKYFDLSVHLKDLQPLQKETNNLKEGNLLYKNVNTHKSRLKKLLRGDDDDDDDDDDKRLIISCLPHNINADIDSSKVLKTNFPKFEYFEGDNQLNHMQHHQNSDIHEQGNSNYRTLLHQLGESSFGHGIKPKKYFSSPLRPLENPVEEHKSENQIQVKKIKEELRDKLREIGTHDGLLRPRQFMDSYLQKIPSDEVPTQQSSLDLPINLNRKGHNLPDDLDQSKIFSHKSKSEKSKVNFIDLSSGCDDENGDEADNDSSSDGVQVLQIVRKRASTKKPKKRSKYFTVLDDDCTVLDPPKPFRKSDSLRCIDGMDSAKPSTSRAFFPSSSNFPLDMSKPSKSKKRLLLGASTSSSASNEKDDTDDVIWDPVLPNSNDDDDDDDDDYLSGSPDSVIMCTSPGRSLTSFPSPAKVTERSIEDEIFVSLQKAFESKQKRSGTSKDDPEDEVASKVAKVVKEKREDSGPELECAVCLENMNSKRGTSATTCGHVYCTPCITEVIEKKKMCPSCRKPLNPSQVHKLFLFG